MKRARVIFHGRVQGVFFRANCKSKADALGVTGTVRNLPDMTVESIMEGDKDSIDDLIIWCSERQPMARVTRTEVHWEPVTREFHGFNISY